MLLQSWAQSLRLLLPKNIKLFMLVTLKSVFDICKTIVPVPRSWLGGAWVCLTGVLFILGGSSLPLLSMVMSGYLLCVFLVARPSVRLKDIWYLCSYLVRYSTLLVFATVVLFMTEKFYDAPLLRYLVYVVGPLSPLTVFTVLFMLDSKNTLRNFFRSAYRSILLVWYNVPIMVFFYGLWIIGISLFWYAIDIIMTTLDVSMHNFQVGEQLLHITALHLYYIGVWVFFPIVITTPIVLLTNYYVKRVHDNFTLYE